MSGSADVNSLELLAEWYNALTIYRTDALEAASAIALEIQRAESWLDEQLRIWQGRARACEEEVTRAKTELSNRRFPDFSGRMPDCSVQDENLWRAETRLDHARDQIEVVRPWFVKLPKLVEESYGVASRHLVNFLEAEMVRGLSALKKQIASLDAYLNIKPEVPQAKPPSAAQGNKT